MRRNKAKVKIKFRLEGRGRNVDIVGWDFVSKLNNYGESIRKRVLESLYEDIRKTADWNIERNRIFTRTPATKRLYNSIQREDSGDSLVIHVGRGLDYAGIHDFEGTTRITAKSKKKKLRFKWHRHGKNMRIFSVNRPGIGFFTRAWFDVTSNLNVFVQDALRKSPF